MTEKRKVALMRRLMAKHDKRWNWRKDGGIPRWWKDADSYAYWKEDFLHPGNPNLARNNPGALAQFLKETTIPMARAMLAAFDDLSHTQYEDRGKEWHEAFQGVLKIFRNMHDAGHDFYNKALI